MSRIKAAAIAAFALTAILALVASTPAPAPLSAQTAQPAATSLRTAPASPTTPLWLRYPAISPDGQTIAFTHKGDIYRVPATGGA
ncbi:MAG: peptidase, partial [Candidatus Aminicenantes bacterium]|nr:peptidase [Candidatus Aminicenantes bacterium]